MYRLLKDKSNEFQCEIKLEGTTSSDASARLFLEADGCEYIFNGQITGDKCLIPMGKLKKYANLLESGKIRLEVVADDTLFVPYENTYELEEARKVTVEVAQSPAPVKKPMVEVKVKQDIIPPTPPVQKKAQKPDVLLEIKRYFKENTRFDGSVKSFHATVKDQSHKAFFNRVCEAHKLDKLSVLKQLIK